jgi:hypothetical protein
MYESVINSGNNRTHVSDSESEGSDNDEADHAMGIIHQISFDRRRCRFISAIVVSGTF